MRWQRILIVAAAAAAGVVVVRDALVEATLADRPAMAVAVWPGHPAAILAEGMERIGQLANAGRPVTRAVTDPLVAAARAAPLSPEPNLVAGLRAQVDGNERRAGQLFAAAAARDPWSRAARYFLADHDERIGRSDLSMIELGRLVRLVPGALPEVAAKLITYAHQPGAVPRLRLLLEPGSALREAVLNPLAGDSANIALVEALAGPIGAGDQRSSWVQSLIAAMIEAGRVDRAFQIWAHSGGTAPDAAARAHVSMLGGAVITRPPFAWVLASDAAGSAEFADNDSLHLLYFGRDPQIMASKLLLLAPGHFQLSFRPGQASGDGVAIGWKLTCLPGNRVVAEGHLGVLRSGATAASLFDIAPGCGAQRLTFDGTPQDIPATVDVTIDGLSLRRAE